METRRVVVTGLGTLNPIGNNVEEFFTNLENGVSGAGTITHFNIDKFKTKIACEVKGFDPLTILDRKEAKKHDLYSQYAMYVADQAFKDANLEVGNFDGDRTGVIWGSGIGGIITFQEEIKNYVECDYTPRFNLNPSPLGSTRPNSLSC